MTEAMQGLRAVAGYLAAADATEMVADEQAQCLLAIELIQAMSTAARAWILAAFIAAQGHHEDACYGAKSWLTTRLGVTKGAAAAYLAWARRAAVHPRVLAALAATEISESFARTICYWTGQLPPDCQDAADAILVAAARSGASLADLAALAAEIYARSRPPDPDEPDGGFDDRSVRLETTFEGAGVLGGDLTPDCAAVVTAVLDALSAPAGAGDLRTHGQRYHDALADAMRRLLGAGLLPERAGQPVRAWAHLSLAELLALDGDGALLGQWTAAVRARWAGARAAASAGGSDGAAWLDGDAAAAVACDALVSPVVMGDVDPGVLDDLVLLCVELSRWDNPDPGDLSPSDADPRDTHDAGPHDAGRRGTDLGDSDPEGADPEGAEDADDVDSHDAGPRGADPEGADPEGADREPAGGPSSPGREALERAIIGKAVDLLSGPGGLASFLRRQQLGARGLDGPSLPLDIGYSDTV